LINFKFENVIKQFLEILSLKFTYLRKKNDKYYTEGLSEETINNIIPQGSIEIPYKNISIKRTASNAYTYIIDLNDFYNFFNKMAISFGGVDKFTTPFECLDITGSDCINIDGLKNIVNQFKIIKSLNLSGVKLVSEKLLQSTQNSTNIRNEKPNEIVYQSHNFLINNLDFLRSITMKHSFLDNILNPQLNNMMADSYFLNKLANVGFDLSYGITPLLTSIYLYDTPISNDTFNELILLFKV
jgi:hypothetical protein